jgi:hypothetical protein
MRDGGAVLATTTFSQHAPLLHLNARNGGAVFATTTPPSHLPRTNARRRGRFWQPPPPLNTHPSLTRTQDGGVILATTTYLSTSTRTNPPSHKRETGDRGEVFATTTSLDTHHPSLALMRDGGELFLPPPPTHLQCETARPRGSFWQPPPSS